ncbi:spermidine synthase [Mycolicibacterium frederiksbergense]|uniref:Spermidine synthase n=2 Tax=Mycolicibacterium frederiksbergense TaxID=117567 RepID=A0A6H0S1V1_9MYCO|nr:spermidine synthase [Mycolicibacterium frederiksbergense]
MIRRFQELGWQDTPMGELSLRRRFDLSVRTDVYEIKLDDEYVMTSLFTVAERELATLGLARTPGTDLDVVIGGLGLGYTAQEALTCDRLRSLTVIEYAAAVIDWHQRGLLPDTAGLAADSRVTLACSDFFADAASAAGFEPSKPGRTYDAILLDIDHSPRHVLNAPHGHFYTRDGIHSAATHLTPGGTFAMWSDDAPDDDFSTVLESVFTDVEARRVWFDNPLTRGRSSATIYLATNP